MPAATTKKKPSVAVRTTSAAKRSLTKSLPAKRPILTPAQPQTKRVKEEEPDFFTYDVRHKSGNVFKITLQDKRVVDFELMGQVIAASNQKGGVGKTATVVSLAILVARITKRRVLLIDMDGQGNSTKQLGMTEEALRQDKSVFNVLEGQPIEDNILETPFEGLYLVPYDDRLSKPDDNIPKVPGRELLLRNKLSLVKHAFDLTFIDTHPSVTIDWQIAMAAADHYIIPTSPEQFSFDGISKLIAHAKEVKNGVNPNLNLLGVVITQSYSTNPGHKSMRKLLIETGKELGYPTLGVIPHVRDFIVSSQISRPVVYDHPDRPVSVAYKNLAINLIGSLAESANSKERIEEKKVEPKTALGQILAKESNVRAATAFNRGARL